MNTKDTKDPKEKTHSQKVFAFVSSVSFVFNQRGCKE